MNINEVGVVFSEGSDGGSVCYFLLRRGFSRLVVYLQRDTAEF